MEETKTIKEKTIELIDALKATCQTYGMGNDGNEYKIIIQHKEKRIEIIF